ncbi:hypothetical protein GGX14DRAFT_405765 [Mycena pura]|uniref:Uncharacterized protein n=1 Tax=Mycena pura TaxID=153505 RepID=A0AAD6URQ1_9AGAR|nr:hypothetical protein GGX14DRAFT_405765 [Mycena pura]
MTARDVTGTRTAAACGGRGPGRARERRVVRARRRRREWCRESPHATHPEAAQDAVVCQIRSLRVAVRGKAWRGDGGVLAGSGGGQNRRRTPSSVEIRRAAAHGKAWRGDGGVSSRNALESVQRPKDGNGRLHYQTRAWLFGSLCTCFGSQLHDWNPDWYIGLTCCPGFESLFR